MRLFLKILLAPIIAALTIFIWLAAKLLEVSAVILNVIAIATALSAACILLDGKTAQGIAGLIAAFLLTPFGLPLLSLILLEQIKLQMLDSGLCVWVKFCAKSTEVTSRQFVAKLMWDKLATS